MDKCTQKNYRYLYIIGAILIILLLTIIGFFVFRNSGKVGFQAPLVSPTLEIKIDDIVVTDSVSDLSEGQFYYKDKIYEYNHNILSFLLMGIDSQGDIGVYKEPGLAGQALRIEVIVLNEKDKTVKIVNIPNNTIINGQRFDSKGNFLIEAEMELGQQFAYGDGLSISAGLMEDAVTKMFSGVPIHGYGIVDVSMLYALKGTGIEIDTETLNDSSRMATLLRLFNTARNNVSTNLKANQITYLGTAVFGCEFSIDDRLGNVNDDLTIYDILIDLFFIEAS